MQSSKSQSSLNGAKLKRNVPLKVDHKAAIVASTPIGDSSNVDTKQSNAHRRRSIFPREGPPSVIRGSLKSSYNASNSRSMSSSSTFQADVERNILEARYLQTQYLTLISQETLAKEEKRVVCDIEKLWTANNALAEELAEKEGKTSRLESNAIIAKRLEVQRNVIEEFRKRLHSIDKELSFTFSEIKQRSEQLAVIGLNIDVTSVEDALNNFIQLDALAKSASNEVMSLLCLELIDYCSKLKESINYKTKTEKRIEEIKLQMDKLQNTELVKKAIDDGSY